MRYLVLLAVLFTTTVFAKPGPAPSAEEVRPLLEGMTVPDAVVSDTEGSPFSLKAMLMQKPSIVLFYRGGWCPYCNRQLAGLKDIEKPLTDLGYQIIAISPQSLDELASQELKTEFAATLLSDHKLNALNAFGISYYVDEETATRYKGHNIALAMDASGKPVLPAPALFIVDKAGTVQLSYVNPDYRVRPSAALILAAAEALAE
ncbi:peroxiredoxin-like family protein [Aestuariibacter sp. A3R04]|uniref:peroxiredoxin-like family protein n=1 Tax=Aestuariibacter sp. A3R04 TaxID=2841571 RepID=UPI001C084548|nr:peroxiredoxin-like family protein [Aestuariibacter sp. A3R04]MBU3023705.1 AhpC/TSA family protein [Aestuariibacter sp. A3R04]